MAGAGADPLANDPLGISSEDLEPASDFSEDQDADQTDATDGPDDQPELT